MVRVPAEGLLALTDPAAQSRATRVADAVLSLIDPGNPRFFRRWAKMGAVGAGLAAVVAVVALLAFGQTPFGRYMRAFVDISYLHRYTQAEALMRELIQERPGERYAAYASLATALTAQDRLDDAMDVMDQAVKWFPMDTRAQSNRCRLGIVAGRAEDVLASCEIAEDLSPGDTNIERRAFARALTGDLAGSADDMRRLVEQCGAREAGRGARRCAQYGEWLAALEANSNPFTGGVTPR